MTTLQKQLCLRPSWTDWQTAVILSNRKDRLCGREENDNRVFWLWLDNVTPDINVTAHVIL